MGGPPRKNKPKKKRALPPPPPLPNSREFKKTTTATVTSLNKRFNEQISGCACALYIVVHFFAVLCKTTMLVNQILHCVEIGTTMAKINYFYYRFITVSQIQILDSFDREKQIK